MAIDTATKRASTLCAGTFLFALPVPDGTVDDNDRAHTQWYYSGIDYDMGASEFIRYLLRDLTRPLLRGLLRPRGG